jgi:6-pyruvoyltetrahydropterin/6-carboxytetrahydropterin synthase
MIHLTRIYRFSAAHRLHNPQLSDAENRELFGKCNNLHGHGHDYVLEITLQGHPDPVTDCLIDIGKMDSLVQQKVLDRFDHVYLNLDTDEFRDLNPTSENIVVVFWDILNNAFAPAALYRLRLWETTKSYFDYFGE